MQSKKRSSKSNRFKYQDKPRMIHENFGQFSKLSSRAELQNPGFLLGSKHLRIPNPPPSAAGMLFFLSLIAPSSSMDVDARK